VCDPRNVGSDHEIQDVCDGNDSITSKNRSLSDGTLCNSLEKDAKRGAVLQESLPGVLEHTEFSRVTTDLGRCTACGKVRAVFRSADGRALLCERCYGRLVKEWNGRKGIA